MSQPKEDLVSSLIISYIISKPILLLNDVLDAAGLLDVVHEGPMCKDSYEGLALWFCSCHVVYIHERTWTGQGLSLASGFSLSSSLIDELLSIKRYMLWKSPVTIATDLEVMAPITMPIV